MADITKPNGVNKLDLLSKIVEDQIIENDDFAQEYLESNGVNVDDLISKSITRLRQNIATIKQREGLQRQHLYQAKLVSFNNSIEGLTPDEIQLKYPTLPKIAARSFDDGKFTQDEMNELIRHGNFLSFLESEFEDESE